MFAFFLSNFSSHLEKSKIISKNKFNDDRMVINKINDINKVSYSFERKLMDLYSEGNENNKWALDSHLIIVNKINYESKTNIEKWLCFDFSNLNLVSFF